MENRKGKAIWLDQEIIDSMELIDPLESEVNIIRSLLGLKPKRKESKLKRPVGKPAKYPLRSIAVGKSMLFPWEDHNYSSLYNAVRILRKQGFDYFVEHTPQGNIVTRYK